MKLQRPRQRRQQQLRCIQPPVERGFVNEEGYHPPPLANIAGVAVWRLEAPSMLTRRQLLGEDAFEFVGPPFYAVRTMRYVVDDDIVMRYAVLITSHGSPWDDDDDDVAESPDGIKRFVGETIRFWCWQSEDGVHFILPEGALTMAMLCQHCDDHNEWATEEWERIHGKFKKKRYKVT